MGTVGTSVTGAAHSVLGGIAEGAWILPSGTYRTSLVTHSVAGHCTGGPIEARITHTTFTADCIAGGTAGTTRVVSSSTDCTGGAHCVAASGAH